MSTKSNQEIRHWWVTASNKNRKRPWHWKEFFEDYDNPEQSYNWGGRNWINSPISFACIEEMREGNIIVAYQAGEGIVGLVLLDSDGYPDKEGGKHNTFNLRPTPHLRLSQPAPYSSIRDLPNAGEHIEFVGATWKQRTVFRISPKGFDMILQSILKFNPHQSGEVQDFLACSHPSSDAKRASTGEEAEVIAIDETGKLIQPRRATSTIQRVVRDSAVGKSLKRLYQYRCQICGNTIELPDGKRYAEVHHLRPVGKPHNGKDGKPTQL